MNEFTAGESDYREDFSLQGSGYSRQTWGITYPLFYGGSNGNRMPAMNFSNMTGVTGSNQTSYARTPTFIFRDNYHQDSQSPDKRSKLIDRLLESRPVPVKPKGPWGVRKI